MHSNYFLKMEISAFQFTSEFSRRINSVGVWNALNQNIDYGFIFESVEKNIKRSSAHTLE